MQNRASAAYGRGGNLILDHLGATAVLFSIQVWIGMAMALILLLSTLCCPF